jgi:heptosyltransferase-2
MNILVISFAGIGDTLFATPLIHELRANYPDARIDAFVRWVGSKHLLEGNPHLSAVHQQNLLAADKKESFQLLWRLRRKGYDLSINTHPQSRVLYRGVARFINARLRVSHQYDNAGPWDRLLVNRTLKQDYTQHAVENNLALLKLIGGRRLLPRHEYEIYLTPEDENWAKDFLARNEISRRTRLGMHVGSGGTKNLPLRRWPLDHYLALLKKLSQAHPELALMLIGGPEEKKDHQTIRAETAPGQVLIAEPPTLRQTAALLKQCDLFLSVDTNLMHLAAAVKTPRIFVIETPTWNKPIEPYGHPFTLIRNPAVGGTNLEYYRYDGRGIKGSPDELRRCMTSVTVDSAFQALSQTL